MGFIGDMFSSGKGAGFQAVGPSGEQLGTAYDQTQSGLKNQQDFVNALSAQNGLANQSSVFGQQQGLANQLQGVANGTGPNPALSQLQQATGQNVANQSALMAGQRGSGANAGLMARLAAQQGANIQQQAVGQGATLQAQQQLAAMQQLQNQQANMGNLANTQVGQQQTGLNAYNTAALQQQSNLLGLQANANSANAGIAGGNQAGQQAMFGGLLGGAGSALGGLFSKGAPAAAGAGGAAETSSMMVAAHGGMVKKYAEGGPVDLPTANPLMQPLQRTPVVDQEAAPQSTVGKLLNSNVASGLGTSGGAGTQALNKGATQAGSGIGNLAGLAGKGLMSWGEHEALPYLQNFFGGALGATGTLATTAGADMAGGAGDVIGGAAAPETLTAAAEVAPVAAAAAHGGVINGEQLASQGRQVPGRATVPGDSFKNDVVPAKLSAGEIVIPRSIAMHPNAPEEAAKFVAQVLSKNKNMACGGSVQHFADGGQAEKPVSMPDPQKARQAWGGAQHGQSFAEGWENAKKFFGAGTDQQQPQQKAKGGMIKGYDEGGFVPDYRNTPTSEMKFPSAHPEGEQALADAQRYWEGLKSAGSKAHDVLFGEGASLLPQEAPSLMQQPQAQGMPGTQMPEGMKYDLSNLGQRGPQGAQGQGQQNPMPNPYDRYNPNAGINLQEQGLKQEAGYQNTMNQASQQPLQNLNDQLQNMQVMTQQNAFNHNREQQDVINDINKGHIDPNAYVNSLSTGQKVGTAIGLILGGMGGGLTHQENPALKFLQSQIDRDVKAQEANINNKHSLLNALEKQYGDKQTALQSLYNIYSLKYENQMKQMAAQNGSQLVNARLLQSLGPLEQQRQQNNMQMGMRSAAMQHMQGGGDAAAVIPFLVPKEQQTKALEQYGKLNELNKLQQDMRDSAQHLHGKFMNGVLSPNDTNSAKQAFAGAVQKISEGRYNGDAAQKLVESLLPQGMDSQTTYQNKLKRQDDFFEAFRKEPETFLHGLSVPTPKMPPRGMPVKQGMK